MRYIRLSKPMLALGINTTRIPYATAENHISCFDVTFSGAASNDQWTLLHWFRRSSCKQFPFFNVALMLGTFFTAWGRLMSAYIFIYLFISHIFVLHIYLWIEPLSSVYNISQRTSHCILWRFVSYHFVKLQQHSERNVKSTKQKKRNQKQKQHTKIRPAC